MIPIGILTGAATSSFSFLLDQYPGAAAAYSLRKLRSAYTGNCIRVQSSAAGTPQMDIGFVNNVLDITTLQTFVGANTGRVVTWYDQSGNGNNATQANTNLGSIIINAGVLITDNSKPALQDGRYTLTSPILSNTNYSIFSVMSRTAITNNLWTFAGTTAGIFGTAVLSISSVVSNIYLSTRTIGAFVPFNTIGRNLFSNYVTTSNSFSFYANNALITSVSTFAFSTTTNFSQLFSRDNSEFSTGKNQEQIFYSSNQIANNTGINANINAFYTIY